LLFKRGVFIKETLRKNAFVKTANSFKKIAFSGSKIYGNEG